MKNMIVKRGLLKKLASKTVSFAATLAVLANCTAPTARAWIGNSTENEIAITGSIRRSYFERGNGTSNSPYVIARPMQLYYFAWLQDLGMFNVDKDNDGNIDTVYFEIGNMNDGTVVNSIDMTGYSIPPIGTTAKPFLGNFDGNGKTISNVTVSNASLTDPPTNPNIGNETTNAQIIGFFGVVGGYGGISNYSSAANSVSDLVLDDVTIQNTSPYSNTSLAGIAAGYVNGTVTNVGVSDSRIQVGSNIAPLNAGDNISDYSLVGYCTDNYKYLLNVSKVTLHAPEETQNVIYKTVQGEGPGFGGSVNMFNFYNRMYSVYHAASWANYTPNVTRVIGVDGQQVSETHSGTATDSYHKMYDAGQGGSYSFVKYQSSQETDNFYYVYGDTAYNKTVNTITYSYVSNGAYYISCNGEYLNLNENNNLTDGDTPVTKWLIDGNGCVYAVKDSSTIAQNYYYLNYDGAGGITIGENTSGNTQWSRNSSMLYYTDRTAGLFYCLNHDGDEWNVTPYSVRIKSADDHYLNYSVNDGITSGDVPEDATRWLYSTNGYLFCETEGTAYYLINNSGSLEVSASSNSTVWEMGNSTIYNGTYFLRYDNDEWSLYYNSSPYYLITDGNGNYLSFNGSRLTNVTDQSNATKWSFSTGGNYPSGTISTVYNNTTYYLRYNNGLTIYNGNNTNYRTQWSNNGNVLYYSSYYINFKNGTWQTSQGSSGYTISYNGNYLNAVSTSSVGTGRSISDYTDSNGNTVWIFSTSNGQSSSGTIHTIINGTTYYLYTSNGVLSLSRSSTSWKNYQSGNLYISNGSSGYYNIYFENGSWGISTSQEPILSITSDIIANGYSVADQVIPNVTGLDNTIEIADISDLGYADTTENTMISSSATTTENFASGSNATYFPINAAGNETFNSGTASINNSNVNLLYPANNNTGYVVSGNQLGSQTTYGYDGAGDIRISMYGMKYIYAAINSSSPSNSSTTLTYTDTYDERLEVITAVNNGSYNGFYRVSDDYNSNNSSISSTLSNAVANSRKINYNDLGLKRYSDARNDLSDTFTGQSYIYGLHFMNATISKNNCVTISEAKINGDTINNLEVPCDSIDFNVKRRGFITVFAGTYFSGNDAFFSLHEIVRDGSYNISEIKEISKIYKAAAGSDYIYQYTDNSYSSTAARGDIVFDMSWMTAPSTMVQNAVYYFEIPVNGGEFALGSVAGKSGAYLFYLDIAANANLNEEKLRSTVTEKIIEANYSTYLPRGVQLVENGGSFDSGKPYDLAAVALEDGYSGTYPFTRNGNVFTYTDDSNSELKYAGGTLTVQTGSGNNAQEYVYYPNGYTIRYIEHIIDLGNDTGNYDHFLIETIDEYDSSGVRSSTRTVKVYADIDNGETNETVNENDLDLIITLTYNPSGHDNMATRVVRAVSDGGFNISFDENVVITSAVITDSNVHVNFGDNLASVLTTASTNSPLPANTSIVAVDFSGADDPEYIYYKSVYGDPVATYSSYFEGSGANATISYTTSVDMPMLDRVAGQQTRTLKYDTSLNIGAGVTNYKLYGKYLQNSYSYTTKVSDGNMGIITSGTINVNIDRIRIGVTDLGPVVTELRVS